MKHLNKKLQKVRSLSIWGAKVLSVTFLLFAETGCHGGENTDKKNKQPTTEVTSTCTTSTMTSTKTTSTTSSTSTTSDTTTTTTTAQTTLMIQPMTESQMIAVVTDAYVEPVTEYVEPIVNNTGYSESDIILMAQVINKEASASYDGKLAVASVIVNRSNYYGQSISDVIYAPNQFSVVGNLGSYTQDDYNAAVQVLTNGSVNNAYYFDGGHSDCLNHFKDMNNNYIGAW